MKPNTASEAKRERWQAYGCAIYTIGRGHGKDVLVCTTFDQSINDRMPSDAELEAAAQIALEHNSLPAVVQALEAVRAVMCDLFEDLKAYGDQARKDQVRAVWDKSDSALAALKGQQ